MPDYPVYVRTSTDNEEPLLKNHSSAEAVISVVISAQAQGWLRLHGFVVLPEALEMVMSPIRSSVSGVVGHIQAETIPLLAVLLPNAGLVWARRFTQLSLMTQQALDARLNILLLAPVANGIASKAEAYPYSSANPRYVSSVSIYAGFNRPEANGAATAPLPAGSQ
jgi:hypothetical protein